MQRMSRTGGIVAERRRRRAVVLGVPAAIVAVLAAVALWRVGTPPGGEPGASGTIGLNPERTATLDRVEVRQITSPRTFWAGALDDDPVFVVAERPIHLEPGSRVTVEGRVEAAPAVEAARREWGLDEATARAVRERGVYVRATRIRAQSPP
jgi:hypothetical protein